MRRLETRGVVGNDTLRLLRMQRTRFFGSLLETEPPVSRFSPLRRPLSLAELHYVAHIMHAVVSVPPFEAGGRRARMNASTGSAFFLLPAAMRRRCMLCRTFRNTVRPSRCEGRISLTTIVSLTSISSYLSLSLDSKFIIISMMDITR